MTKLEIIWLLIVSVCAFALFSSAVQAVIIGGFVNAVS